MNPDLAVALTERINRAVHSTVGVVESGEAAELADMLRAASAWTAKTMEDVEPTSEFEGSSEPGSETVSIPPLRSPAPNG